MCALVCCCLPPGLRISDDDSRGSEGLSSPSAPRILQCIVCARGARGGARGGTGPCAHTYTKGRLGWALLSLGRGALSHSPPPLLCARKPGVGPQRGPGLGIWQCRPRCARCCSGLLHVFLIDFLALVVLSKRPRPAQRSAAQAWSAAALPGSRSPAARAERRARRRRELQGPGAPCAGRACALAATEAASLARSLARFWVQGEPLSEEGPRAAPTLEPGPRRRRGSCAPASWAR